ncbi:MAG: hypothetical protein D6E12_17210 [Desulfovibrio sp.]|nr:MAG: hypothetical protein D6E12_17210 [Desulfovibrio sp.]
MEFANDSTRLVFLDVKTHGVIEELEEQNTEPFLETGDTVSAKFERKGRRYFKVVDVEDADVRKIYVKKMPLHYTEILLIIIITLLSYFLFKEISKVFIA